MIEHEIFFLGAIILLRLSEARIEISPSCAGEGVEDAKPV